MSRVQSFEEQIEYLRKNGVKFNISDEQHAVNYLSNNNYMNKILNYCICFKKYNQKDEYIDLDFAYLEDLSSIDMYLRLLVIRLSLHIEHYLKLATINDINGKKVNPYKIVTKYYKTLSDRDKNILCKELSRNTHKTPPYISVYEFLENIPLGQFITFYRFYFASYKNEKDYFYMLTSFKSLRNASAHNSCVLSEIKNVKYKLNNNIFNELLKIENIKKKYLSKMISKYKIEGVLTVLYLFKNVVTSQGVLKDGREQIHIFKNRMLENLKYYNNSYMKDVFEFLKIVIDSWYPL